MPSTLEVVGLSKPLTNDEAEIKTCQFFRSLDCIVSKEDLDACHWLKEKERVIVKLCRKKDVRKFWKIRTTYGSLLQIIWIPQRPLRFFLTKVCALTIVSTGQQAKNYMVKTESLVGRIFGGIFGTFQTGQLRQSFRKIADHYIFLK